MCMLWCPELPYGAWWTASVCSRSAAEINAEINQEIAGLKEGITFSFMPPPILGLGNGSGYQLFIEDRGNLGYGELQNAVNAFLGAIAQTPGMGFPIRR